MHSNPNPHFPNCPILHSLLNVFWLVLILCHLVGYIEFDQMVSDVQQSRITRVAVHRALLKGQTHSDVLNVTVLLNQCCVYIKLVIWSIVLCVDNKSIVDY